ICSDGLTAGDCLVLVLRNETWEGALEYCQKQNNDLASLSSLSMMDSALGEITQAQTEYVWTGLRFLAGDWFWVNGNVLDYTAWSKTGQPQCPARDLHCGALDKQTRDWTNRDCEETLNFFCSAQAVKGRPPVRLTSSTPQKGHNYSGPCLGSWIFTFVFFQKLHIILF
uniref:C-type lectin domain-containing protein n=1 Tax=Sinocyclocheilus grahami TaxID=75366 RepID=A0A672L7E4_SINGR